MVLLFCVHFQLRNFSGLIKTVAAPESRLDDSARFWTAAALCRFSTGRRATQSGRGLPQSTTLPRHSFARNRLGGHRIFETAPGLLAGNVPICGIIQMTNKRVETGRAALPAERVDLQAAARTE